MKYLKVIFIYLLGLLFGCTAPVMVPFALLFTKRDAKVLAWSWYDTPDEKDFIGLYEPKVQKKLDRYGWFVAAWYWFGIRNRGHGFASLFSQPAPGHWANETGANDGDEFFFWRGVFPVLGWFELHLSFGWAVYASSRYKPEFEYRPKVAIKTRRPKP